MAPRPADRLVEDLVLDRRIPHRRVLAEQEAPRSPGSRPGNGIHRNGSRKLPPPGTGTLPKAENFWLPATARRNRSSESNNSVKLPQESRLIR